MHSIAPHVDSALKDQVEAFHSDNADAEEEDAVVLVEIEGDFPADHAKADSPHVEKEEDSVAAMVQATPNPAKDNHAAPGALAAEDLEARADHAKATFPRAEEKAADQGHSAHAPSAIPMISQTTPSARNSGTRNESAIRPIYFFHLFFF